MSENIKSKLINIQNELKAPKNQYNSFGKYNYRSCEDILEAVKPLLQNNGLTLSLSDEVQEIGGKLFVVASATVLDIESTDTICVQGFAGHELEKKGMDFSQITGAASSYARKYALNGLFLIDDSKDSDATNTGEKNKASNQSTNKTAKPQQKAVKNSAKPQQKAVKNSANSQQVEEARQALNKAIEAYCERHGSDVAKTKAGIAKRPDYQPTVEFYQKAAKEFQE